RRQKDDEEVLMKVPVLCRIVRYVVVTAAMFLSADNAVRAEDWRPLVLQVSGIDAVRGGQIQVFVFLRYGFPKKHEKSLKSYVQPVAGNALEFAVEVPADTPFAIKVHHDEDSSGTVTKNWTGIFPAEGFGFSAGAKMNPFPPSFADAKTTWPSEGNLSIAIVYP
ncbi:MAG: DUF2141 domain-containing protein, partial [Rhodospirillales bacterium]|nr:DUF2141 domain-containing protein [Rhodospirillales bacterium]